MNAVVFEIFEKFVQKEMDMTLLKYNITLTSQTHWVLVG